MIPFLIIMIFVCSFAFYIIGYMYGKNKGWDEAKEMYDTSGDKEVFEFYDWD